MFALIFIVAAFALVALIIVHILLNPKTLLLISAIIVLYAVVSFAVNRARSRRR